MHVQMTRSGGLAGITMTAELDTTELGESAAAVERALREVAAGAGAVPGGPDRFSYQLTLRGGDQTRQVTFGDPVPAALQELVLALQSRARPA